MITLDSTMRQGRQRLENLQLQSSKQPPRHARQHVAAIVSLCNSHCRATSIPSSSMSRTSTCKKAFHVFSNLQKPDRSELLIMNFGISRASIFLIATEKYAWTGRWKSHRLHAAHASYSAAFLMLFALKVAATPPHCESSQMQSPRGMHCWSLWVLDQSNQGRSLFQTNECVSHRFTTCFTINLEPPCFLHTLVTSLDLLPFLATQNNCFNNCHASSKCNRKCQSRSWSSNHASERKREYKALGFNLKQSWYLTEPMQFEKKWPRGWDWKVSTYLSISMSQLSHAIHKKHTRSIWNEALVHSARGRRPKGSRWHSSRRLSKMDTLCCATAFRPNTAQNKLQSRPETLDVSVFPATIVVNLSVPCSYALKSTCAPRPLLDQHNTQDIAWCNSEAKDFDQDNVRYAYRRATVK